MLMLYYAFKVVSVSSNQRSANDIDWAGESTGNYVIMHGDSKSSGLPKGEGPFHQTKHFAHDHRLLTGVFRGRVSFVSFGDVHEKGLTSGRR
jgi:hypothetical protein